MGLFSSPKTTTKESFSNVSEPWSQQIPYLKDAFSEANRLYRQQGPAYYPGSTVAGFSPEQQQAQQMAVQRGMAGNQTVNMAQGYAQDVINGKYLNSDPYADQVYQGVQQKVMPSVNSQWSNSGRYGSQLHAGDLVDRLTTAYAPYASQIYQSERGRMDNAMSMAPTLAQQDWTNIDAINNVGTQRQDLAQQELEDATSRWNYYQNQPGTKLDEYLQRIMGNYGGTESGTSKSTSKTKQGIGNTILGALATGVGAYMSGKG